MARQLRWVLSYLFLASMREEDQYQSSFVALFGCFRSYPQRVLTLHMSESSVMYPLEYGSVGFSKNINAFLSVSMARILLL